MILVILAPKVHKFSPFANVTYIFWVIALHEKFIYACGRLPRVGSDGAHSVLLTRSTFGYTEHIDSFWFRFDMKSLGICH